MQDARQSTGSRRTPRTIAGKTRPTTNPAQQQTLHQYQNALHFMQEGKFEKARAVFENLSADAPPELQERVRVYLAACSRNAPRSPLHFDSTEEQYDYAISLLNTGYYEDARDHFDVILDKNVDADYVHYGLAILNSITGQAEECLHHLSLAIALNPQNRLQARSEADFQNMSDDPRFTELLYPESS